MGETKKVALGGGCHWCTEAVFQSLKGVCKVQQGFVAPIAHKNSFSEGIIVHYNPACISLKELITIHLHTHASTKNHSMRHKYRSAVYCFSKADKALGEAILKEAQRRFNNALVTAVVLFGSFKASEERFHNYYYTNTKKPFCETHIAPKLRLLLQRFSKNVKEELQ